MTQPVKIIISRLVLIAYVPLVMLLPFFHTDRLPQYGHAHAFITQVNDEHHLSEDSDFCVAHQYSSSHSLTAFYSVSHYYIPLYEIVFYTPFHTTCIEGFYAGRDPPAIV